MNDELNALIIEEVVLVADRRFARAADRQCLTRTAMGVAIDLLSTSPRVADYIPELALGSALRRSHDCRIQRIDDRRHSTPQSGFHEAEERRLPRSQPWRDASSDPVSASDF